MRTFLLAFFFMTLAVSATEEKPTLGLSQAYPLVGEPVQLTLSHASYPNLSAFDISVTYRPNSTVEWLQKLDQKPNSNGLVTWVPKDSGICILQAVAPDLNDKTKQVIISKQVSVRFNPFPLSGLLIMALAIFTLFGGFLFSLTRLKN